MGVGALGPAGLGSELRSRCRKNSVSRPSQLQLAGEPRALSAEITCACVSQFSTPNGRRRHEAPLAQCKWGAMMNDANRLLEISTYCRETTVPQHCLLQEVPGKGESLVRQMHDTTQHIQRAISSAGACRHPACLVRHLFSPPSSPGLPRPSSTAPSPPRLLLQRA